MYKRQGFHYIPYRCVGREGVMPVFTIEKMCICAGEEQWVSRPLLGIGEQQISEPVSYTHLDVYKRQVIGLVLLYSTSAYNGETKFHDSFYYLKKQGFATILGTVGMFVVARIDYRKWAVVANIGYLAAIALSVAVMLVGDEYNLSLIHI